MAAFIHSVLAANQVISSDGDQVFDLPVNPLSVILVHISPLNNTGTIANYRFLEALTLAVANLRVTHKGSSVIDARGDDLVALALLYHRIGVWQSNAVETNDVRRSLVIPILFGRKAYMASEAFPETRRGEFQMTINWDIAATGYDGLRISIETIELPDAQPEFVQKVTTLAQTFAATDQNDIEIPIGNVIRGVLLFGTTAFLGAAPAPTLGRLEFLVDNRQVGYTSSDFEVLRAVAGLGGVPYPPGFSHIHGVNAAGAGQEDTQQPEIGDSMDANYVLMDFDPLQDDEYSIDTDGAGRVNVRVDAETANAVRALPIERVPVAVYTG